MKLKVFFALLMMMVIVKSQDDEGDEVSADNEEVQDLVDQLEDEDSDDQDDEDQGDDGDSDADDDDDEGDDEDDDGDDDDGPTSETALVGGPWDEDKLDAISRNMRESWCRDQVSICVNQCRESGGGAKREGTTCRISSLAWSCECNDGSLPDLTKVDFTIPFFQCRYDWQVCNESCTPGDQGCVDACNETYVCGTGTQDLDSSEDLGDTLDDDENNRAGSDDDDDEDAATFGAASGLGANIAASIIVLTVSWL